MSNPNFASVRYHGVVAAAVFLISIAEAQTVDNPDVFRVASQVAEELELVREYMGRPFNDSPRLPASDVSQPEVFFQAQTLFRKVNQLAQEYAGANRVPAPPLPEGDVTPADTLAVLSATLEQLRLVKSTLGIEGEIGLPPRTRSSATGVFMTIIDANRQLNLLIDPPIRPSDVHEQVTLAVVYAAGILAHLGITEVPEPPPFDGHKRPSDVYARLLQCIDVLGRIANDAGVQVLRLSSRRNIPDDIEPGHVYDIARILVAGLAALADAQGAEDVFPTLEAPERIFPTQVYARASVLLQQLEQLDRVL